MYTELKDSIGFKISQTANILNNNFNQKLQEYDIAIEQRATLEIIKYEKNVNQTMIAQILAKDKTTISRTLKALEKKGYIVKNQFDKRTNHIELTALGEEVLKKSSQTVQDFRGKFIKNLSSEEIKQLRNILDKVLAIVND